MSRILGIVVVVAVAALLTFGLMSSCGSRQASDTRTVETIERLLATERTDDAKRELVSVSQRLDAPTRDYLTGLIALFEHRDADAEAPLVRAAAASPEDWRIVSALGSVRMNLNQVAAARELVERYLQRHPADERAMVTLAQYWLAGPPDGQDAKKALALLDRIAALSERTAGPGDRTAVPDALIAKLRTQAESESGHMVAALAQARAAVKQSPRDPEAWYGLGEAARRAGQPEESLDAFRKSMALAPGDRRTVEQLILTIFHFEGDGEEALRLTQSLIDKKPDDLSLQVLRARALFRAKREDDADGVYRGLLAKTDLPRPVRLEVLRNHALLLGDWKAGGRAGPFLDEALMELREYERLGGVVDPKLRSTWDDWKKAAEEAAEKGK